MVGVLDDRNAVHFGEHMDMFGADDGPGDGRPLVLIRKAFAGIERRAAVGELDDHRGIDDFSRFHHGIHAVGAHDVHRRHGKLVGFGDTENL